MVSLSSPGVRTTDTHIGMGTDFIICAGWLHEGSLPPDEARLRSKRDLSEMVEAYLLRRGWTDQRQHSPYEQAENEQREGDDYDLDDQDRAYEQSERQQEK